MINSISGINLKIGADLSDLKKEVGKVGDEVKEGLKPAEEPVKTLKDNFKETAASAAKTAISAAAVAVALGKIGKSLLGFTKDVVNDALDVHPETKQKVDDVKAAFETMKTTIGESLIPLIDEWAPKITDMLNRVSNWAKENPESAKTMLEIVGALGVLSTAMGMALPVIAMFNLGMLSVSGPVLAVVAGIAGVVAIVALLNKTLFESDESTRAFTGNIEEINTATEQLTEDAYGNMVVSEYKWTDIIDPETGEEVKARWDEFTQSWVAAEEQGASLEQTVSQTSDAITQQAEAVTEVSTAADEADAILQNLQQTFGDLGTTAESGGMTEAMASMSELLESEAFKQFATQPVSEDVTTSWDAFSASVSAATEGFSSISEMQEMGGFTLPVVSEEAMTSWTTFAAIFTGNEEEGTVGLIASLTSVNTEINTILASLQALAAYMQGDFVAAIIVLESALCVIETDEEGNTDAGGGNTLYNALGAIQGVLGDILSNTQRLVQEWTGSFVGAVETMKQASGKAEGALEGVSGKAWGAAEAFGAAAAAVRDYIAALQELADYKSGGSGGSGTGTGFGGGHAEGGTVRAGVTYLVGENGPELYTASRSGYIVPNDELGGGGTTVNVNIEGSIYGESYLEDYVVGKLTSTVRRELILAS